MISKIALSLKIAGVISVLALLALLWRLAPYIEYAAVGPRSGDVLCRESSGGTEGRFFEILTPGGINECGVLTHSRWRWYVKDFNGTAHNVRLMKWIFRSRGRFAVLRAESAQNGITIPVREKLNENDGKQMSFPDFYGAKVISGWYVSELKIRAGAETDVSSGTAAALKAAGYNVPAGTKIITPKSLALSDSFNAVFVSGIETGRTKR
ncbi:MAG: hypothetical protein WCS77_08480 [Elusimicrobiaceae bacterium]